MPALVAGAGEEGRGGDGRADPTVVDELAAGLNAAAQEGVGRTTDPQILRLGHAQNLFAFVAVQTEGLLVIGVLAGFEALEGDFGVDFGNREVDDDFDIGGEQFLDRAVGDGKLGFAGKLPVGGPLGLDVLDLGLGAGGIDVGESDEFDVAQRVEVFAVDAADVAATDDANFGLLSVLSSHLKSACVRD